MNESIEMQAVRKLAKATWLNLGWAEQKRARTSASEMLARASLQDKLTNGELLAVALAVFVSTVDHMKSEGGDKPAKVEA